MGKTVIKKKMTHRLPRKWEKTNPKGKENPSSTHCHDPWSPSWQKKKEKMVQELS